PAATSRRWCPHDRAVSGAAPPVPIVARLAGARSVDRSRAPLMTAESNASFEIDSPVVFTAGTVGEPGHRVFYVQAQGDGQVVTLKLEKQQVGALADYLSGLL